MKFYKNNEAEIGKKKSQIKNILRLGSSKRKLKKQLFTFHLKIYLQKNDLTCACYINHSGI